MQIRRSIPLSWSTFEIIRLVGRSLLNVFLSMCDITQDRHYPGSSVFCHMLLRTKRNQTSKCTSKWKRKPKILRQHSLLLDKLNCKLMNLKSDISSITCKILFNTKQKYTPECTVCESVNNICHFVVFCLHAYSVLGLFCLCLEQTLYHLSRAYCWIPLQFYQTARIELLCDSWETFRL